MLVATLTGGGHLCAACLLFPPDFDRVISVFAYAWPINKCIAQYKYDGKLFYVRSFVEVLLRRLKIDQERKGAILPQALIPVPLGAARLRERGFNQALELAKGLSKALNIPVYSNWVVRKRETSAQAQLTATKRKINLKHAFILNQKLVWKRPAMPKYVAIIDDVLTTGATVSAMTRLLKAQGVEIVEIWTICRAL
jgi:ComF family protein